MRHIFPTLGQQNVLVGQLTRNIVMSGASTTVPSTVMVSSFAIRSVFAARGADAASTFAGIFGPSAVIAMSSGAPGDRRCDDPKRRA
jgi:hypothetical protein